MRARDLPRVLLRGARGTGLKSGQGVRAAAISTASSSAATVRFPLQVDGEDAGDVTEAVYEAERDAVTVLV